MKLKALVLYALTSLFLAQGATAALIDNGDTTLDTSSGLSWLDLTESIGFIPSQVLAGDGGFLSDGWSIATGTQVDYLFEQAGATAPASDFHFYADSTVPDLLISLLGRTAIGFNGGEWGQGWADNGGGVYSLPAYTIEINQPTSPFYYTSGSANVIGTGFSSSTSSSGFSPGPFPFDNIGVYLVKPVPLPGTFWIFLIALGLLAKARFSKTHH